MPFDADVFLQTHRLRVEQKLQTVFAQRMSLSPLLKEAMQYSALNGGKRIRALLAYAANTALHGDAANADDAACALELIHAYSLVHDDLPAMDNDALRRGKPTCHIAFDEATAILAGDTLQTLAFDLLSDSQRYSQTLLNSPIPLQLINALSHASILMAEGQCIDQNAVGTQLDQHTLEQMHNAKTGALIRASVKMGALSSLNAHAEDIDALEHFAKNIGLAFQVQDDILDVISDTQTLGKKQGADAALEKPTFVTLLGLESAQTYAEQLHNDAIAALEATEMNTAPLLSLADFLLTRSH